MAAQSATRWVGSAGAGGFDLRSDVMTTPTANMLAAIQNCSLLDDVYREDQTTIDLEQHCAKLAGKEAGLLVLSGTMGNQIGLRTLLTQPPHAVLCDHMSHIFRYEAGGVSSLTGAMIQTVVPRNGLYLTLEDVQAHAVTGTDVHDCTTRVISLENTINGVVMPLAEVRRISEWARSHGIKMHCDGARLWEAVAAGAGSLPDFAACFDTVTLCFSKGLGAPIGSVLLGSHDAIRHATWVRKSIGGGLRQAGVIAAPARVAVDETFGTGPNGEGGLLRHTHTLATQVGKLWTDRGGKLLYPVDTNMCWMDLAASGVDAAELQALAEAEGLRIFGNRLVCHYQIYENRAETLPRLERVFTKALAGKKPATGAGEAAQAAQASEPVAAAGEAKSMYPTQNTPRANITCRLDCSNPSTSYKHRGTLSLLPCSPPPILASSTSGSPPAAATAPPLSPSSPSSPSASFSTPPTPVTVHAMSELQRRWAKAKLDAAQDGASGSLIEEDEGAHLNNYDDDSASSASSVSSTGTVVPSASQNLFVRPQGLPKRGSGAGGGAGGGGGRSLEPIPWTAFFERELFLSAHDGSGIVYHAYLTSPVGKGPLFVMHHGAGSSGLSFAVVGAEIRKRLPSAGILSLDARDHGLTTVPASRTDSTGQQSPADLSLGTLSSDLLAVIKLAQAQMHWPALPPLILVGHSLGGAVVTDLAFSGRLDTPGTPASSPLLGFAVLDVVEGSAMDALQSMQTYLGTRPSGFATLQAGIEWHIRSRTIRNGTSARTSVPALLVDNNSNNNNKGSSGDDADTSSTSISETAPEAASPSPTTATAAAAAARRPWRWRTDLGGTQPFWQGWFAGLSKKFLGARGGKLLLLAGTDRLDTELTIGQMQGKYALQVFPEAGHFIHEDLPEKTALTLVDFYNRNNRSALVLPPKVSELLAQGKKV
ncbi:hypothetical protein SCUCBS95973_002815 [Sporothrix curviconia]|uniref:Protein phosphatase methylesterase 1 n=1 Tax=Sporothrix curviconia TaxID=1260050 RepID=A0ABP0BA80_9PEZI